MNTGAAISNEQLVAIAVAYTNAINTASAKLKTSVDAAKVSGKTDTEIQALIRTAYDVWKSDMKDAKKVANIGRENSRRERVKMRNECKKEKKKDLKEDNNDDKDEHKNDNNTNGSNHGK
jgi:hypothetical protein